MSRGRGVCVFQGEFVLDVSRNDPIPGVEPAPLHAPRQHTDVLSGVGLDVSCETISYVAGWGESGALEAVSEFAQLIDGLALRIAHAIEDPSDGDPAGVEHQVAV
jgi:hypothetical protein